MVARYAVPPSSSEHSHLSPLFSHQHLALTPLAATLMKFPASVANKGLMDELNPLDATLTKKRGGRVHFILLRIVRAARAKRLKSFRFMQLRTLLHSPKTNSFVFKQFRTLSQKRSCEETSLSEWQEMWAMFFALAVSRSEVFATLYCFL